MNKIVGFLLAATVLFSTGCASRQVSSPMPGYDALPEIDEAGQNQGWWFIQFLKRWPENTPPPFHYDLLLAEQVIRPSLTKYKEQIDLWRFHRRAARDRGGSKFSFIFYAEGEDARSIVSHIKANTVLQRMVEDGLVVEIRIDDFDLAERPQMRDASDRKWSNEIRDSWPYFVMGVSQSWLGLIEAFSSQDPIDPQNASIEDMVEYYAGLSNRLDDHWIRYGGHAYIHHLNALFGYEPVLIRF